MAFAVMTVIGANPDEMADVLADIMGVGMDAVSRQPGFRLVRVYSAENGTEVVTLTEWDSREQFLAFRQTDAGRQLVSEGVKRHPRISFLEIVSAAP